MKRVFIGGALAIVATAAMAVPARRHLRTFTQSDGTTLTLRLVGDEKFHTYVTTDNLPVTQSASGDYHYATRNGVSAVAAHNPGNRAHSENAFIASHSDDLCVSQLAQTHPAYKHPKQYTRVASRSSDNDSQVPTSGSPRIPVLLLEYADYPFRDGKDTHATFTNFFNDGDESARQYFIDQSNGKYTPQFDIYGPYTLSKNRSAYGGNDYYGYDKGVGTMVGEGCQGLASQIDFSRYDNNNDGECDVVIVIYAGDGEASSEDKDAANAVWPCQWNLSSSDFGKSLQLNGVTIDKFGVFNELSGFDMSQIDGIGTFCHEFSHCLGLPDFYCTDDYSNYFGMSEWSLMDYGCYNNEGRTPIGYSAYEKNFMGWIDYIEPEENTLYTLPVFNSKNEASDMAVKVSGTNRNEYYIIENRAQQGWDRYIPAEGLMITHVTYDAQKWINNTVNNFSTQGMTIIPADNDLDNRTPAALAGDLWPYNGNDALTDESRPAAVLNLGSQKYMGKPITDMTINADGTASFWYIRGALPKISTPQITSIEYGLEGVTATWSHEPEGDVTYTVEVRPHSDLESRLLLATDFTSENHGWETSGYTETTDDGLRMGSGKNLGSVTSTPFTPTESTVTICFDAKYYSGDGSSIRLSTIGSNGSTIESTEQQLTAQTATYTVTLKANANQPTQLKIETFATKKRAYLSSAIVYNGDVTSSIATAAATESDATRLFEGITGKSHTLTDLESGERYDIRVKAVANDSESFLDSDWSPYAYIDLTNTAISSTAIDHNGNTARLFNLQGIQIDAAAPAPGIYIRHTPEGAEKIIIR